MTSKGFELVDGRDHEVLTYKVDGLTRAIWTKLSRGTGYKVYRDTLLRDMKEQLKVTRQQLDRLIECDMKQPEYTEHLRSRGFIR